MTTEQTTDGEQRLPELELIDMLDAFIPDAIRGRMKITKSAPLTGVLNRDITGRTFLAPEPDYRGGGMGSIVIRNLLAEDFLRFRYNQIVKVTGVYEEGELSVESIALEGEPFKD